MSAAPPDSADVAIVGAGAAGLMAAIWAGRNAPGAHIVAMDGADRLGAKILIAGGGRCNVTHDEVSAESYAGSSRNAIRKVLRRFDVPETTAFFESIGVPLKREETGKLFPVSNRARTVLDGLLGAAAAANVQITNPFRVMKIARNLDNDGAGDRGRRAGPFLLEGPTGVIRARTVILATGGRSVPRTGSDGGGYALARSLGHSLTPQIFPALVPLTLPTDHFLTRLSGVSIDAEVSLVDAAGHRLEAFTNAVLFTHFGLSGPCILDISRYVIDARRRDAKCHVLMNCTPGIRQEAVDEGLRSAGPATVGRVLGAWLPERLARALCEYAHVAPGAPAAQLQRERRRALVEAVTALSLPITGDRGFAYAEVTAGGVPLNELHLETMESRVCPGLYLCGEICDVDGQIGGYNFQWAWASGFVAGSAAAAALKGDRDAPGRQR